MSFLGIFKSVVFRLAAILLGTLCAFLIIESLARSFLYREPWHAKLVWSQKRSEKYPYKRNKYRLRDDDFLIPKPFSRIVVTFGEPLSIEKGLTEKDLEKERLRLESLFVLFDSEADRYFD